MAFIIVLVAMLAFMYLLLIRPQRAKQRKTQEMLSQLGPGDEVLTVGGIYGDVVEVEEDKVVLEIAEDVHIEVSRRAIAQIIHDEPPVDEAAGELEEAEDVDDGVDEPTDEEAAAAESVEETAEETEKEIQERAR